MWDWTTIFSVHPAFSYPTWPLLQLPEPLLASSSPIQSTLSPALAIFLNIYYVHPLPKDSVTPLFALSLEYNPNWLFQPSRSITVCPHPPGCQHFLPNTHSPPHILLLSSCLTILQMCYRFSQFSILFIACTFMWASYVPEMVQGAGNKHRDEQGTAPVFLSPIASAFASLYAWNASSPLLSIVCLAFNLQLKSYFVHQPLPALLGRAFLTHFSSYYISL